MSDRLVLYTGEKNNSSWSMRAFVALHEKGVPFEERTISLVEDKARVHRREVSPTGKVPVIHHYVEGAEARPRIVPDSLAIVDYLEETFRPPQYPSLWPADPDARAHARWLAAAMHSGWPKLRESMSFNLCFLPERPIASPEALAEAGEILALWQVALSVGYPGGEFLCGPFSGADILFAPVVVRLTAFDIPTTNAPRTGEYMTAVLNRPSVRRWMEPARTLPPIEAY